MRKTLSTLIFIALSAFGGTAQQQPSVEYGSPNELAGLTKVFVNTGLELEVRNNIIKEIRKKLPALTFVDTEEEGEVFLVFGANAETYLSGVTTQPIPGTDINTSRPEYRNVLYATGHVATFPGPGRIRLLMDFKDSRRTPFERRPSTNFARAFVKAYLAAEKRRAELEKNPYYRMMTGKDKKPS